MPRRRSSIIRKAKSSWQGIHCFQGKELVQGNWNSQHFFEDHLAGAKSIEVEIGSGSGDFLLNAAKKKPHTLFVGIEYSARFLKYIRDKCREEGLKNICLIYADARLFVEKCLPPQSVNSIHIYFPDPWPKSSQKRRRFLNERGLKALENILKSRGFIHFVTDHPGYAKDVQKHLIHFKNFSLIERKVISRTKKANSFKDFTYAAYGNVTHFGQRFLKEGKQLYLFEIEKKVS